MKDHTERNSRSENGVSNIAAFVVVQELIGAAVLLLTIRAAEPLFFGEGFYANMSTHPFWIVVILASVQGGLLTGVVTAGFAAMLMDWQPRPIDVDITAHYISLAIVPVQWLLAAIVIGSFRQQQIRYETRLEDEVTRLTAMSEDFANEINLLDQEIQKLELQSATQVSQTSAQDKALAKKAEEPVPQMRMVLSSAEQNSWWPQ